MRLSVIFFEGSWVTLSSWVWFWHDFPEGVRSLENQKLQFILANKFILKKLIWFQGNADNSSKIGFLWLKLCSYFSREVMFDTLSFRRKSVPPCSSCCGFKTFRRRIGEKVKQKQDWSTPPSPSIPMHMVHRVTKAATFFWLVSLNFFLLLFSCLCTGMLRMVFFFSYFFFPFFCWFSFCMLFVVNWTKMKIVWKDIVYIWVKEFVVGLMMLLLFLCKDLILGKI